MILTIRTILLSILILISKLFLWVPILHLFECWVMSDKMVIAKITFLRILWCILKIVFFSFERGEVIAPLGSGCVRYIRRYGEAASSIGDNTTSSSSLWIRYEVKSWCLTFLAVILNCILLLIITFSKVIQNSKSLYLNVKYKVRLKYSTILTGFSQQWFPWPTPFDNAPHRNLTI